MSDHLIEPEWTVCSSERDKLGESPVWIAAEQALYWVNFYGPHIHKLDRNGVLRSWTVPKATQIGSIVAAHEGLLAATDKGLCMFRPATGDIEFFADPNGGRLGIGYNDAKVDRAGNYWVGTFDASEAAPRGILYRVQRDGQFHVGDSGYVVCNGPAFSPNGETLYFSDTVGRQIFAYDVDHRSFQLHNRRQLFVVPADEGMPDGLTVDAEGHLWLAHYGGGLISRLAPDGNRVARYKVPAINVTSLCFGGPDLGTLYVTTGESVEEKSGALVSFKPGRVGLPERLF